MNQPFTIRGSNVHDLYHYSFALPISHRTHSALWRDFDNFFEQMRLNSIVGCFAGHPLNNYPLCPATALHTVLEGAFML